MAEYDRGVYEPSDRVRVFDGSEDDEDTEGSRLPVLIVIALVVLASFAGVVWLAYEKGVASGRNEPRVVMLDSGKNGEGSGDTTTQYKGLKIYEQPAPNDADVVTAGLPAKSETPPPAASNPAPTLRTPPTDTGQATSTDASLEKAAPASPMAAKPKTVASLPKKPQVQVPPTSVAEEPTETAPKSEYLLQIGSYKSEQEAASAWTAAKAAHASVFAGLSPDVKKVDLGDKGIWFRLRVQPFDDKAAANALCERLKAEGGTCLLAR